MTKDEALDKALDKALEALEESVDLVREDYENAKKLYGNYPSRQARLLGMEDGLLKHEAAITAIKQARSAKVQEPVTWYEGAPPFPQDQEWFIAETIYGDRVVLRSLDEGREHKGNYAFKTADQTYMKQEIVKRWMQFPDCEYLPPKAQRQWDGLTDGEIKRIGKLDFDSDYFGLWYDFAKNIEAKLKEKNT